MKNEKIFVKAIKKAAKNGFDYSKHFPMGENLDRVIFIRKEIMLGIIFSHDFAKAFIKYLLTDEFLIKPYGVMKVKKLGFDAGRKKENYLETMKNNFLQRMVKEKEPLLYLKRFLLEQ